MIKGYLYQKSEEELKKDITKGLNISTGVDVNSIMDTIIIHEINNPGKPEMVISLLKHEIMILLEKVTIEEEEQTK